MGLTQLFQCLVRNKRHFESILSNCELEGITYNLDLELFSGKRKMNRTLGPHSHGEHLAYVVTTSMAWVSVSYVPSCIVYWFPLVTTSYITSPGCKKRL